MGISVETPVAPLIDKPQLDEIEQYYWRVFSELSATRATNFGVTAISISEIFAYCQLFYIEDISERSDLIYIITKMDSEFLEYFNKKKE